MYVCRASSRRLFTPPSRLQPGPQGERAAQCSPLQWTTVLVCLGLLRNFLRRGTYSVKIRIVLGKPVLLPTQALPEALLSQPAVCRSQQPLSRCGRLVGVGNRENPIFKQIWSLSSLKSMHIPLSLAQNIHSKISVE